MWALVRAAVRMVIGRVVRGTFRRASDGDRRESECQVHRHPQDPRYPPWLGLGQHSTYSLVGGANCRAVL